jgi:hypothetical protein
MAIALCLILVSFALSSFAQPAGTYRIPISTLNMGGGVGSSTNYCNKHSVGQSTPVGISQSPNYGLIAGFQATTLEDITLPEGRKGDVDANGSIDVLDVLLVVNHILGTDPLSGEAVQRADCNSDGAVDVLDALGIVNVILGIGSCVPASASAKEGISPARIWSPAEESDVLSLSTDHTSDGQEQVEIPIWIDSQEDFAGVELKLSYDPTLLAPGEPRLTERSVGMTVVSNAGNGELSIVVFSTDGTVIPSGSGPVLKVPFVVQDSGHKMQDAAITFVNVLLVAGSMEVIPVKTEPIAVKIVPLPSHFELAQNYPNPFNPSTDIRYGIPENGSFIHTTLKIYNVLGQEVRTLVNEPKESGFHTATWNGKDAGGLEVGSGVYFYRLSVDHGRWSETRKMVLMR